MRVRTGPVRIRQDRTGPPPPRQDGRAEAASVQGRGPRSLHGIDRPNGGGMSRELRLVAEVVAKVALSDRFSTRSVDRGTASGMHRRPLPYRRLRSLQSVQITR